MDFSNVAGVTLLKLLNAMDLFLRILQASSNKRTPKKQASWKNGFQGLKTLLFFSIYIKHNVKMIHFQIKSRDVQGLAFVQNNVWKMNLKTAKFA